MLPETSNRPFARVSVADYLSHAIAFAKRGKLIDDGLGAEWRLDLADCVDVDFFALAMRDCHCKAVSTAARWVDECGIFVSGNRRRLNVITKAGAHGFKGDKAFDVAAELCQVFGGCMRAVALKGTVNNRLRQ